MPRSAAQQRKQNAAFRAKYPDRAKADGVLYRERNREKLRERGRAHYWKNREKILATRYEKEYGCTLGDKAQMYAEQGGRCAICDDDLPSVAGAQLDHNHTTGAIRELLCRGCNHLIANAKEEPRILFRAVAYLEKHDAKSK